LAYFIDVIMFAIIWVFFKLVAMETFLDINGLETAPFIVEEL